MVIREAEEAKTEKKQGWFSKRKKKTSLPVPVASRPPSAASFGSSRRKPSFKSQEDDIPPRTDATPIPLPSPAHTDPSDRPISLESDSAADIPVHAGFNLAAIKHMIGEAERHPEQLVIPQTRPNQGTSVSPPTSHSINPAPQSPPPIRQAETGAVKAVPYDDDEEKPGRNLPDTLNATFTTSMSLHDKDPYRTMDRASEEQREAKLCLKTNDALSRPTYPPEMSPVWTSPKGLGSASDTTSGKPFAGSTDGLSFGVSSNYLAQPPHSHDRLGALGAQSTYGASPGLSFGSPDGTITFQSMEPDPWSTPAESRNQTGNGFSTNPWTM